MKKPSHLEVLAEYPREDREGNQDFWSKGKLEISGIPEKWLEVLESGQAVWASEPGNTVLGTWKRLCIFPLRLDGELSGLLCLGDYEEALEEFLKVFLKTVTVVFELWLGWLNERKRLEDFIQFMPNPLS